MIEKEEFLRLSQNAIDDRLKTEEKLFEQTTVLRALCTLTGHECKADFTSVPPVITVTAPSGMLVIRHDAATVLRMLGADQ